MDDIEILVRAYSDVEAKRCKIDEEWFWRHYQGTLACQTLRFRLAVEELVRTIKKEVGWTI